MEIYSKLRDEYIKISSEFYPGLATHWGIQRSYLTIYSKKNILKTINCYKNLQKRMEEISYKDSRSFRKLNRAVKLRLFELEALEIWRKPNFYIINSLNTISVIWRNFENIFQSPVPNHEQISCRIKYLPDFFKVARENLNHSKLTKLDCLTAILNISHFNKNLEKIKQDLNIPLIELSILTKEINSFSSFLKNKSQESIPLKRPLGEENLATYIYLESGLTIDLGLLLEKLKAHLSVRADFLQPTKRSFSTSFNEVLKSPSEEVLSQLIKIGKNHFNVNDTFIKSLQITELNNINVDMHGKFGYMKCMDLQKEHILGAMIYDKNKVNNINSILGVIHEVYPGHHYSWTLKSKSNYQENIIFFNPVFEEGWAKYCEHFFTYKIFKDINFIDEFELGISKAILLAMATLYTHSNNLDFRKIISTLSNYFPVFSQSEIKQACIQAYIYPIESISYMLGFYFVQSYFNKRTLNPKSVIELVCDYERYIEEYNYEKIRIT
ncbi:DUF885 family protein [Bacillus sp. SM2101]|uniref:DUF885 family protein n=1 Tax=Bacillus sp. SM2101 TaxID=2805366 RepID=UPI001BDE3BCE|nr:DUF885 family protein [Bacillus sp. SM2101]